MISHPAFVVEPWQLRETELRLDVLAQTESVFALSNGHLGLRGNLEEGEPAEVPGTYLNAFYEKRPLRYAETAYGNPEAGQTVVNVTNGKIFRLLVGDEPFDVRYGRLLSHERVLDMRGGVLHRRAHWISPVGREIKLSTTRLVSFVQRAVAAVLYEVEPVDGPTRLVVQSELVANEPPPIAEGDPRAAAALQSPLLSEEFICRNNRVVLSHITRASGLRMAAGMEHVVDGPPGTEVTAECEEDLGRVTITADVPLGQRLRIVKFLAYGWSGQRSQPAVRAQVEAALAEARHTGWDGLVDAQRAGLDDFWGRADIELEGDAELQQAVRFSMFHVLQAGARGEQRAIPGKGLTGPGYDGHTFWDTEVYVLPLLSYIYPQAAADVLRWRHSTLDLARTRARQLGLQGATFPWRTITGEECSGYWPAGTAQFHINAGIADAVIRYQKVSGDEAFEREVGIELLVETARLWRSLGHHDSESRFRIDGVTGPDEYSAVVDNNIYTNLMAQQNLGAAADVAERHPDRAAELGVGSEEVASWRDAARAVVVRYDEKLGVHAQDEDFTRHERWDFENTGPEDYPLLLHFPYLQLYRKQVVKQADLVLAMMTRGEVFTDEQKLRNFDYYERLTVRDSSLSACIQAAEAAEVGHVELAYDYFGEAALMDLDDLEHNTRDGLHIASLAGACLAPLAGFAGVRDFDGGLHFAPRLPQALSRVTFRFSFRERLLMVAVDHREATYSLLEGPPVDILHYGEAVSLETKRSVRRRLPRLPSLPTPRQPAGRAPARRAPQRRSAP
ncbi:MAG TPA: glycosyl hydrolase family 65 protein [Acidimicrobiales bacterium]|nr:glycosyl hydrolase family 65 protein [Acidimicrobiales bacterium]